MWQGDASIVVLRDFGLTPIKYVGSENYGLQSKSFVFQLRQFLLYLGDIEKFFIS